MTLTIVLPSSTSERVNVKDAVLGVLSTTYPLSLKKLFTEVKKQYGLSVTYQGVRKAVNSLEDARVLIRNNLEYSLNKDWILNARTFVQRLHETYFETRKGEAKPVTNKNYKEFTLETLFELDNFWHSVIIDYLNRAKNVSKKAIAMTGNQWWMILNLGSETCLMKTVKEKGYRQYITCNKNNSLNQWAGNIYKRFDFPFTAVSNESTIDVNVYGNLVIEVSYQKEILAEIDRIFKSVRQIKDFDPLALSNLGHKKTQVTIKLFEDSLIADSIREKALKQFK
ncbi:MAG TPA: hypothetical protein VJJ82_04370 [Candidatus Nanoarchaeia archaeon]|nr:hypothetical protein [Candidatus Nanoarchaeia archaeon]